jgi:hypothetical protein
MLGRRATMSNREGCRRVLCLLLGRSRGSRWRSQSRMCHLRRFGRVVVGGSDGRMLDLFVLVYFTVCCRGLLGLNYWFAMKR